MTTISRSISATWWYTLSGVLAFQLLLLLSWLSVAANSPAAAAAVAVVGIGGLAWVAVSVVLLLQYRHRDDAAGAFADWKRVAVPLAVGVAFGAALGILTGYWTMGLLPLVQLLMLLNWPPGVRVRLVIVAMVLMTALWVVDQRAAPDVGDFTRIWWMLGFFSIVLPAMTVLSLWWWDVLVVLDRARIAESRLSAAQERLRLATDVHDLQGHHLQVIALQLELAQRLLEKDDRDAALEQLHLARASVADARQGTRDLATRFRGVPLPDEIANAVDLLRAAGTDAAATVAPQAASAPADVLGPVIRETTTNVLKHGAGGSARLSLARTDDAWRYEIANDAAAGSDAGDTGTGLAGIERRVAEAGGTVEVHRGDGEFRLIATVPARAETGSAA